MTVRIYPAPHKHPLDCEVCGGDRQVKVSRVGRHGQGKPGAFRWLASRLSVVIPCPQCAGAEELFGLLPGEGGGPRATA
jgi:hypothetical protein